MNITLDKPWCKVCGADVTCADLHYHGQGKAQMSCIKCDSVMVANRQKTIWRDKNGSIVKECLN